MQNDRKRFMRLMGVMKEVSPSFMSDKDKNAGLDSVTIEREDKERQLSIIDSKIAELEESDDPNSLESLAFWRKKRSEIIGN